MAPWLWIVIWAALVVGAVATFAYIGLGLRDRAEVLRPELEVLAEILCEQAAGLLNYSSIANDIRVSADTVKRWIKTL